MFVWEGDRMIWIHCGGNQKFSDAAVFFWGRGGKNVIQEI